MHFGTVSMTKIQRIIAFHWTASDQELRLITKNLRYKQRHILFKMLLKFEKSRLPQFLALDYPTLYPRSMPITLKLGILLYCGSPAAVSDSLYSKPQYSWGRSGTQVSASQTQLAASVFLSCVRGLTVDIMTDDSRNVHFCDFDTSNFTDQPTAILLPLNDFYWS